MRPSLRTSRMDAGAACSSAAESVRSYEYRLETYQINGSLLRTEQFNGRDYIVCPVVSMLGNTVVWSVTAPAPEFVPAEVVYVASQGWNYRPVVMNHPQVDGEYVSANSPAVLEQNCFGFVFNADYTDKDQLLVEAWLDSTAAEKVGPEAVDVISRLQAGEIVEVSNGQYVIMSMQEGKTTTGQEYFAVWEQIVPDHLAMLGQGSIGACSVEMGCGANRVLVQKDSTNKILQGAVRPLIVPPQDDRSEVAMAASDTKVKVDVDVSPLRRMMTRMAHSLGLFRPEVVSDSNYELWDSLYELLRSTVPMFNWIVDIKYQSQQVIYTTDTADYSLKIWQRGYSIVNEAVTLADEVVELQPTTTYEPVNRAAQLEEFSRRVANQPESTDQPTVASSIDTNDHSTCACKGGTMANQTANTNSARLLGDNGKPDDDKKKEDDQTPAADPAAPAQPVEPAQPASTTTAATTTNTVEIDQEELKTLRQMAARYQQQENKKRDGLLAALKGATKFSEDRLKQMPLEDLSVLAETVGVGESAKPNRSVDYSASRFIGEGEDISTDDESSAPVMPKLSDMIKARAAQQKTN
jgi:hypothetical protein